MYPSVDRARIAGSQASPTLNKTRTETRTKATGMVATVLSLKSNIVGVCCVGDGVRNVAMFQGAPVAVDGGGWEDGLR